MLKKNPLFGVLWFCFAFTEKKSGEEERENDPPLHLLLLHTKRPAPFKVFFTLIFIRSFQFCLCQISYSTYVRMDTYVTEEGGEKGWGGEGKTKSREYTALLPKKKPQRKKFGRVINGEVPSQKNSGEGFFFGECLVGPVLLMYIYHHRAP